jgi:monofunctional biosynthetic peptidoglycan transglycosylase
MKARKQSFIRRFLRRLFKVILYGFILSLVYLLLCKWLMPPVTITQLGSWIGGMG